LDNYRWSIGTVGGKPIPVPVLYLVGVPAKSHFASE
jgi:hypothetical protein